MSTSSVRLMKERGGGGGKVTAAAPPMPTSAKPSKTSTPVSQKSTCIGGKENPRPTSRVRAATSTVVTSYQKPIIPPMPRIDKDRNAGCENVESRVRKSTSSVLRGRSSSPSEFTRVLSDLRKKNTSSLSRVSSVDRRGEKGAFFSGVSVKDVYKKGNLKHLTVNGTEKCENGIRVLNGSEKSSEIHNEVESNRRENGSSRVDALGEIVEKKGDFGCLNAKVNAKCEKRVRVIEALKDSRKCVEGLEESSEILKDVIVKPQENGQFGVKMLEDCTKEVNLSTQLNKSCLDSVHDKSNLENDVKILDNVRVFKELKGKFSMEKRENGGDLGLKDSGGKLLNGLRDSEVLKEKGINKYPSKLHEKLAFLEGKVKRIATDIKRTKEMLDMNNPDASKVILTDIQEKISGIEKVMGHVVNGADGNMGFAKAYGNDDREVKTSQKSQDKQVNQGKTSVKGLNTDELEARFFPHHKLLRDRTSLKPSLGSSQAEDKFVEFSSELEVEEKSLSPIDENSIALEFLASLNKEKSKVTSRVGDVGAEFCKVSEMNDAVILAAEDSSSNVFNGIGPVELVLTTNERLDEFDEQENRPTMTIEVETEDNSIFQLNDIGRKASTGGWFVSEGESVLLAHDDGSCSFYDIANCEEKAEYKPPVGILPNAWRDCWIIRAPSADGCSGRYVVAASAGNAMEPGFCSWDFYTKNVCAFHTENGSSNTRTALGPLSNNTVHRRNTLSIVMAPENRQWWYKPCGPLIISTASCQRAVRIYDVRDGEQIMKWDVQKPVLAMDYSSPLQWRNRGKVVVAEGETISLWDVSSLTPQALLSVSSSGRKISALHVNNTDAELGGGVRQRVSSSEAEGHDGVFCTLDSTNVLDFRHPSGVGVKIPKHGVDVQSVFSRGDSIFLGCTKLRSAGKMQSCSQVLQFSLRKQRLLNTYALPESNAHFHHTAITQVWGNSNLVMGVCGQGLFVFDALKDDGLQPFTIDYGNMQNVRETIGPDDLYSPSFDYMASRVLLISRDRPALSRFLS
ncbi:unnamed protein product [Ilex paraguariensis]|uniref:At4g14310 8-bladed propeller domain-containing protein n=1 Tax=Ilex paraguariensis TaxID=185542 RepID=A0ABC8QZ65_9AQUA